MLHHNIEDKEGPGKIIPVIDKFLVMGVGEDEGMDEKVMEELLAIC